MPWVEKSIVLWDEDDALRYSYKISFNNWSKKKPPLQTLGTVQKEREQTFRRVGLPNIKLRCS
jgi:hypothetical protein